MAWKTLPWLALSFVAAASHAEAPGYARDGSFVLAAMPAPGVVAPYGAAGMAPSSSTWALQAQAPYPDNLPADGQPAVASGYANEARFAGEGNGAFLQVSAVPEAPVLPMLIAGLAAIAILGRRRSSRR